MRPSEVLLLIVCGIIVLGLNGLTIFMVLDEWWHDKKASAFTGSTLIVLFDLLVLCAVLHERGM